MSTKITESISFNIKDNKFLILAITFIPLVLAAAYGCESKVSSLDDNIETVNRDELYSEVQSFLAKAEARFASLDRQDEFKEALFNQTLIVAETGNINPLSVLTSIGSLLFFGTAGDNIKKRKTIKNLKASMIAPNVNSG